VFAAFLALMLANFVVFFQFGSTYPLYLVDHYRLTPPLVGLMFTVNTLCIVMLEMLLVDYIKHWPLLPTIGVGCLLSCTGFGILPFGSSAAFAVLAMLILTMGEMMSFALAAGFVANRSEAGGEGLYMGWYTMTPALATVFGPAIGSAIYQVNRDAVWICSLLVGLLTFFGFQLLASWSRAEIGQTASETPPDIPIPLAPLGE
jgi:hypothetical protein